MSLSKRVEIDHETSGRTSRIKGKVEGQADKLRAYAALHDLGEVVAITDPGWSGKNMERPGQRRVLEMAEKGHVTHVLVWRLDRLSRNLGDLQTLATDFLARGIQLHSVTENLDLSSATGRMFYNVWDRSRSSTASSWRRTCV